MPFLSVTFANYRNLENTTLDLLSREVYFIGENGQGKSNILESLYVSAYGNSFRTNNDQEIIKNNTDFFSVRSLFRDENDRTQVISILKTADKKKIEKNAKVISDRKELINTIPCVLFCHDDLDFAIGIPERRRFFIDQSLSMYDSSYIDVLRKYKKILKIRNTLLKDKKENLLDVIDVQLVEAGIEVIKKRDSTIRDFNRIFTRLYNEVAAINGVTIEYSPSWKETKIDDILQKLIEKRNSDLQMSTTLTGPHRDRIRFVKDKKGFTAHASTGQRRLLSLLLRTAQAAFYSEVTGKKPVMLMDDVMLELDPDKRQKFISVLPEYDQLICTFLPGEPFERYKKTTTRVYTVKNGVCYE